VVRGLSEVRRDHHQPADARRGAVLHHALDRSGRDGDDREIDRLADRGNAGVGTQGLDLTSLRVDRVDGSPEAGGQEIREQGGADRTSVRRCTDERATERG
jgi:hypothetical protein